MWPLRCEAAIEKAFKLIDERMAVVAGPQYLV